MKRGYGGCVLASFSVAVVMLATQGCQSFNMTEEDFQRQQRGQMADPQTGRLVGAAGSIGCLGAAAGYGISRAIK